MGEAQTTTQRISSPLNGQISANKEELRTASTVVSSQQVPRVIVDSAVFQPSVRMLNQARHKGCAPRKHGAARPRLTGWLNQRCAARWRITLPTTVPRRAIVRLWCKGNDGERGKARPPDTGGIRPRRTVRPIRRDVLRHAISLPFAVRPALKPPLSARD